MKDNQKYEQIHQFLLGTMNEEEKKAFKKEMDENPVLKNDTLMEQRLLNSMEMASDNEIKNTIKNVHQKLKGESFFDQNEGEAKIVSLKNNRKRMLMAAAAAITLVIAAWWVFNQKQVIDIDKNAVYANYFSQETNSVDYVTSNFVHGATGTLGERDSMMSLSLKYYNDNDFKKSVEILNSLNKEFPGDNEIEHFLALSLIGTGNREEAIDLLRPLTIGDFKLQDEAKWYLGLLLMEDDGNYEEARDLFRGISDDNSSKYNEKAKNILKDLNWSK